MLLWFENGWGVGSVDGNSIVVFCFRRYLGGGGIEFSRGSYFVRRVLVFEGICGRILIGRFGRIVFWVCMFVSLGRVKGLLVIVFFVFMKILRNKRDLEFSFDFEI